MQQESGETPADLLLDVDPGGKLQKIPLVFQMSTNVFRICKGKPPSRRGFEPRDEHGLAESLLQFPGQVLIATGQGQVEVGLWFLSDR